MIKAVRKIFEYIYKIDRFISKEQIFNLKGGKLLVYPCFYLEELVR
jgi:hypothetical protein